MPKTDRLDCLVLFHFLACLGWGTLVEQHFEMSIKLDEEYVAAWGSVNTSLAQIAGIET